ncbi:MAG: 16S rRNA (adenine(1518)-N(6)/adenine(1519)-N(6))-dimethyltransferase RsmA [Vicinamibacterales bacterium]
MRPTSDGAFPRARKRFGQHFLEPVWARRVVDAVAPSSDEVFVEIGPGRAAMTGLLAERAAGIVACEIDRDLAGRLRDAGIPRVRVVEGDFLTLPAERLLDEVRQAGLEGRPLRVAGNLPYNVASPILFRLVDLVRHGFPARDATVMLQREVADRLLAQPGTRDYGVLTVLITHRATVRRLVDLPPGAFRPAPRVRSTVVGLTFHAPQPPVADEERLAAVTQAIFSRRRKTVANALLAFGGTDSTRASRALATAGIAPARRPETLSVADIVRLVDVL